MKLKRFAMVLVAVSMLATAALQIHVNKGDSFARNDSKKEAIKEKQKKAREERRRKQTMFAIKANEILLTTTKERISIQ